MERAMLKKHLALAESHVMLGEQQLARQRDTIAGLHRDGHDTKSARELLRIFEESQRLHLAERERLRKQLA